MSSGVMAILREASAIWERAKDVWWIVPRQRKYAFAFAGGIMLITSAGNTLVAVLLGRLIDQIQRGVKEDWTHEQFYWAAGLVLLAISGIYLVRETLNVVRRYLVENAVTRLNKDIQTRLMGHLLRIDLSTLSREKVGALHGKIFRSADGLIRFLRLMFIDCFPAIFTGFLALVAAVTKHPLLGLVMIGVAPLAVWLTMRQLASQKGVRLELIKNCEEIDGIVVEQLGGAEYIRVANTYPLEVQRLATATEDRRKREIRHHFEMSLFGCAKSLNEGFFHVIVLGVSTYLAVNGQLSYGDILTFSVLFLNVMAPLNEVHRVMDEGHEAGLRVGDLLQMLREPMDASFCSTPNGVEPRLELGQPVIEIENLFVDYYTAEGQCRRALDGINLSIKHGETIGIAGPSGSGKSTWIKVLLRLIHAQQGKVRLAGVPLEQMSRRDIAKIVGYVGQNPFVFSASVRENIAYGEDGIDEAEILRAAEAANLHHEISSMPNGYDTVVVERGQNVSGGQRQRLALARILLKKAGILILDEATSALDNISERHVQRSLGVHESVRTTIIIAHRLTTLKDCDRILVFDQGRIVQQGTYEELALGEGMFAELVSSGENGVAA